MKSFQNTRSATLLLALAIPITALADLSGTATLTANSTLNMSTGVIGSAGGDILWTGTSLIFQGTAKGGSAANFGLSGATTYASVDQSILQLLLASGFASAAPIPASQLTVGAIFGVQTTSGNLAKALVTAASGTSLSFQYTTYGATSGGAGGGPTTPTITGILNNSSVVPQGFPNYGIPPSSLFVVRGANLANDSALVLQDSMKVLPLSLNGAKISVTVNGKTVTPAIYYTSPTQVAAVLPAATPIGDGTLTLSYNDVPSAPAPIHVISAGVGINTYNGLGVATDAVTGALITYSSSAVPGEVLILWGTGLGADLADPTRDTTYTSSPHPLNTDLKLYLGGVLLPASNIVYQGASIYPGVDVIGFTIPANTPTGCSVSLAAFTGSVVSNVVALPINTGGGACSDSTFGTNGSTISNLSGKDTVRFGSVVLLQSTTPAATGSGTTTSTVAQGLFEKISGAAYVGNNSVSLGGCSLTQTASSSTSIPTVVGLNAGNITMAGPLGTVTLSSLPQLPGSYTSILSGTAIPSAGGTFVFNGTGGSDVGSFTATVNFPNSFTWTNQSTAASVTRSGSGLPITWTGGASGTFVVITGTSSSSSVTGSYTCIAPASAGQFTVPSYILLGLPAGSGTTSVENSTNISTFSTTGIDYGTAFGAVQTQVKSTYN